MMLATNEIGMIRMRQQHVARYRRVLHQVHVQQAQRLEREHRVQAGAGIGHQQLVLPHAEHDAGAGHRIAQRVQQPGGHRRHRRLQRPGDRGQHRAGQRHHEQKEEQREPDDAQRGPAQEHQHQRGQHEVLRQHLEHHQALRAAEHVHQARRKPAFPGPGSCPAAPASAATSCRLLNSSQMLTARMIGPCPCSSVGQMRRASST